MSDLINRADAIEAVAQQWLFEASVGNPYVNDDDIGEYRKLAEELFEDVPSAEAEWIKVTENTPPEFPCLVCDANGNQPFVPMGIVTITDEEHGEWHIDGRLWDSPKVFVDGEWGNQISYGNRITAWMPLPKPYKGGDSE